MSVPEKFVRWLHDRAGPWKLAQVTIRLCPDGKHYELHGEVDWDRNRDIPNETPPQPITNLQEMREIVKRDEHGNYRPVKGWGNLRGGWITRPLEMVEMIQFLDSIYPTSVANALLAEEGLLGKTEFAETASRQTGMYHIVKKITPEQLEYCCREVCDKRCLKQRLWSPSTREVNFGASELPFYCPEACNYFVGEARAKMKKDYKPQEAGQKVGDSSTMA